MCELDTPRLMLTRRSFLTGLSAVGMVAPATHRRTLLPPVAVAPGLAIHPRSDWADGLPHPGQLPAEADGDVRVLLVHHTVSANTYAADDVPDLISGFHSFHTGADRRWPDVAYNFFVDRFGGVWEGRAGSLERPVIADASGGNQGYSQLCCLIGDFQVEPPTSEAVKSLTMLLGWLANKYGIDPGLGARTSFVSRGSNRWDAGDTVECATIAGHRDMSQTACPGDAAYALVAQELPRGATAFATQLSSSNTTTSSTSSTITEPSTTAVVAPSTIAGDVGAPPPAPEANGESLPSWRNVAIGGVAAAALVGVVVPVVLQRRIHRASLHRAGAFGHASVPQVSRPMVERAPPLQLVEPVLVAPPPPQAWAPTRPTWDVSHAGEDRPGSVLVIVRTPVVVGACVITHARASSLVSDDLRMTVQARFRASLDLRAATTAVEDVLVALGEHPVAGVDLAVGSAETVVLCSTGSGWCAVRTDSGTKIARPRASTQVRVYEIDVGDVAAVLVAAGAAAEADVRAALRGGVVRPGCAVIRRLAARGARRA